MSKNQMIIALVVLCLVGAIWGSFQDKKSKELERQLAAVKQEPAAASVVDASAVNQDQPAVEELKSQNEELLKGAATLKGTIASQQQEITELKQQVSDSASGSHTEEILQAALHKSRTGLSELQESLTVAKAELAEKSTALTAAEEALAGVEEVKSTLANNVDAYSARSQKLSVEVEECGLRVSSLEKALEERTKILLANEAELARTRLNMNVLLSKIEAQNNSLFILEETRAALAKELAAKFLTIEDLERQLSGQVAVEAVVVEESPLEEAAPVGEGAVQH